MKVKAVLFDLDGTVTRPCLDFAAMKAEMGIEQGHILEAMAQMSAAERSCAEAVLNRHETVAAQESRLNPGAAELLARLKDEGRKLGLITRNCSASVQMICAIHGLSFDVVLTREDEPAKPDPYPVRRACEQLAVAPEETIMVGDYLHDMQCGQRAGALTVLLSTHPNHRDFHGWADFVINELQELPDIIAVIENGQT